MIKFKKVTKKFVNETALQEVDFEVDSGEFVFLMGPSGAGKTTLLRLLLKAIKPSSGEIIFNGQNLSDINRGELPAYRRQIGAVFQDYKLLADRTIFENIALPLEISAISADDIKKKVNQVLKLVGLKNKANFFPVQLSGGELQRVVIARAVVNEPKLVFADEPTGNLDEGTGWQIVKLLKKINQAGTTVIMATHDKQLVKDFKKRIIYLKDGKIKEDDKHGRKDK